MPENLRESLQLFTPEFFFHGKYFFCNLSIDLKTENIFLGVGAFANECKCIFSVKYFC